MNPRIILITDPKRFTIDHTVDVIERVAAVLEPGALMVQHRDKESPIPVVREHALRLREVTKQAGALLALNEIRRECDQIVDIAEEIGADGIHATASQHRITNAKMVVKWVSTPAHDHDEAMRAHMFWASAVLASPIFTSEKGLGVGTPLLHKLRGLKPRIYALGGVDARKAPVCAGAGAHGVAVIRALLGADDPAAVASALAAAFAR